MQSWSLQIKFQGVALVVIQSALPFVWTPNDLLRSFLALCIIYSTPTREKKRKSHDCDNYDTIAILAK